MKIAILVAIGALSVVGIKAKADAEGQQFITTYAEQDDATQSKKSSLVYKV